jgi:predicted PurR-regulated permease PerM
MKRLETLISFIFTKKFYHKAIAYWLLILFLYLFKDFALLFFLTFIFAYLFFSWAEFLKEKIDLWLDRFCKKHKNLTFLKGVISINFVIIFEYIVFLIIFITIISSAIPKLQSELTWLSQTIPALWDQIDNIKIMLWDINKNYSEIDSTIQNAFNSESINYEVIFTIFDKLKSAWSIIFKFIFALILSFVFLLDRHKLQNYLKWIKKSNFSFLYKEYKIIFDKIIRSFGLILKAQSMIALANATLTIIGLFIIGTVFLPWIGFPYLMTLWLIVFIFWFIPVVWVFLSSIPILIVWYSAYGGFLIVAVIVILIFIIHFIEAYILNPKIVSSFLELPMSLTFIILIVWEHFFGIAGLLIWVSLFYFLAELLKDIDDAISKKHKLRKIEKKLLKRVKKTES